MNGTRGAAPDTIVPAFRERPSLRSWKENVLGTSVYDELTI